MTGVVPCRVLVGYDGSPQADRAIAVAGALLPQAHAAIATVAHSFMPSPELLHEILNERENVTIDDLAAVSAGIGLTCELHEQRNGPDRLDLVATSL